MRGLLRSRFLRGVVVGVASTLFVLIAMAGYGWSRARSSECAELPREDLSLREMAQLRRRMDVYKRDPVSTLILSGREASFLVREEFRLQAWLGIEGAQVHLEARVPEHGRCWNLAFQGRVEVERGVAHVVPTTMSIGKLDLGWVFAGRSIEVPAALVSVQGPEAVEILDHLVYMQIADGTMFVRIDDPGWIR